jgi:hypothetical protein
MSFNVLVAFLMLVASANFSLDSASARLKNVTPLDWNKTAGLLRVTRSVAGNCDMVVVNVVICLAYLKITHSSIPKFMYTVANPRRNLPLGMIFTIHLWQYKGGSFIGFAPSGAVKSKGVLVIGTPRFSKDLNQSHEFPIESAWKSRPI